MGWNDHAPAAEEQFEEIETLIADYGDFPLTDEEQTFMAETRDMLDAGGYTMTESQEALVAELWEKMISYSCAVKRD